MNLEGVTLSKISQIEKRQTPYDLICLWNQKKTKVEKIQERDWWLLEMVRGEWAK